MKNIRNIQCATKSVFVDTLHRRSESPVRVRGEACFTGYVVEVVVDVLPSVPNVL